MNTLRFYEYSSRSSLGAKMDFGSQFFTRASSLLRSILVAITPLFLSGFRSAFAAPKKHSRNTGKIDCLAKNFVYKAEARFNSIFETNAKRNVSFVL